MTIHNPVRRVAVGLAALVVALLGTATAAGGAPASTATTITAVGRGSAAAARVVDVASSPQTTSAMPLAPAAHRQNPGAALPSHPTSGRRPAGAGQAATDRAAVPNAAPLVTQFDGATGSNCSFCQRPSDVNAAVGRTLIAEATNVNLDVYSKTGAHVCHVAYNNLLSTSDGLTDPRIVYDNVFGRFVTVVIVVPPAGSTAPAAIWVAVTRQPESPCGSWFTFRVTLNSAAAPPGAILDFPYVALDVNSILVEGNTSLGGAVFAIPKSAAYNGNGFSFPVFAADIDTVPVTNSGIPMRGSPNTYWLAAIPGTGYKLYRMTNSAGPNTTFTLQATINSPFNRPTRRVNQPGTTQTLDPGAGVIVWPPVLAATNLLWFTHGFDFGGFPTVRYGAINVTNNTIRTAAAFHDGISDDFNSSISVGDNPSGTSTVFLNWAFTDTTNGIAPTATVNSLVPGTTLANLIGTDTTLITGSSTFDQDRFGDLSSVTIDPTVPAGTCAVTGQQYFGSDWNTRIARIGNC
jgi:hypothetical protein